MGCSWTGDACDFKKHQDQCQEGDLLHDLVPQIEILQTELRAEKEASDLLRQEIQAERETSNRLRREARAHAVAMTQLQLNLSSTNTDLLVLQSILRSSDEVHSVHSVHSVDATYSYGRERVIELAS